MHVWHMYTRLYTYTQAGRHTTSKMYVIKKMSSSLVSHVLAYMSYTCICICIQTHTYRHTTSKMYADKLTESHTSEYMAYAYTHTYTYIRCMPTRLLSHIRVHIYGIHVLTYVYAYTQTHTDRHTTLKMYADKLNESHTSAYIWHTHTYIRIYKHTNTYRQAHNIEDMPTSLASHILPYMAYTHTYIHTGTQHRRCMPTSSQSGDHT